MRRRWFKWVWWRGWLLEEKISEGKAQPVCLGWSPAMMLLLLEGIERKRLHKITETKPDAYQTTWKTALCEWCFIWWHSLHVTCQYLHKPYETGLMNTNTTQCSVEIMISYWTLYFLIQPFFFLAIQILIHILSLCVDSLYQFRLLTRLIKETSQNITLSFWISIICLKPWLWFLKKVMQYSTTESVGLVSFFSFT